MWPALVVCTSVEDSKRFISADQEIQKIKDYTPAVGLLQLRKIAFGSKPYNVIFGVDRYTSIAECDQPRPMRVIYTVW